jgi:hypothetical protein
MRTALVVGVSVIAAVGAAGLGFYMNAAPACDNTRTLGRVYVILHGDFHLNSVFVNDVKTVSGDLFSTSRDCTANITPIRGNEDASASQWRAIRYHVAKPEKTQPLAVTVALGGDVPFVPPSLSLWRRLQAYL